MNHPLAWLRSLTRVTYHYIDPYEAQRAHGLVTMAISSFVIIVLGCATFLFAHLPGSALGGLLGMVGFLLVAEVVVLLLINRGQLILASLSFVLAMFIAALGGYLLIPNEGLLVAFSVPVVAAGVLLNRRGMAVMIGLVLVSLLIASALVSLNALPTPLATVEMPTIAVGVVLPSLLTSGVLLVIFAGGQRTLQRRSVALAEELRSSAAITQAIAGIQSVEKLLARTVELIREGLNYYHVRIFLLEEKTQLLVLRAGTTYVNPQQRMVQRRVAPDEKTVLNDVVREGATLRIDTDSPAGFRSELLSAMQGQVLIPIRREGRMLGILDVQSIDPSVFAPEDVEILEAIAAQLGIALDNAHLYSELQSTSQERQQLGDQLREATQQIERLSLEVSGRGWSRYLSARTESVIGYDVKDGAVTGQAALTPGLVRALNNPLPELYKDGNEQVLIVPIISRGQNLGAMEFRAPEKHVWDSRSIELARVIAQRLALALDNLRLFEQAQVVASREQIASQIAANLQTKIDVDSLVAVATEAFQEALGATRTSIRLGRPGPAQTEAGRNGSHS